MNFIERIRKRKPLNVNRPRNTNIQRKTIEIHSNLIQAGRLLGAQVSNNRFKLPDSRTYAFELNHHQVELIPLWTNKCHFLNTSVYPAQTPAEIKDRIIDHLATITKILKKNI